MLVIIFHLASFSNNELNFNVNMNVIHLYVTNGLENTEYGPELMDPYIIKPQARHHYS